MTPVRFLVLTFGLYLSLVIVFGSGSEPVYDPVPTSRQTNQTVVISTLSPQQQLDQIQSLEALRQAQLAEYDTYPYYEEDIVEPTYAPNSFGSYKCGQWMPTAISQGWPDNPAILKVLDRVMWRESRCTVDADSGPDHGLTQINQIHTKYLDVLGWSHDDMFDPASNLRFAWLLYSGREAKGQCGWQPWSISC